MIEKSVVIAGLARNCAEGLRTTLPRLSQFCHTFRKLRFVFVTNDNEDDTEEVLRTWARGRSDVEIIQLDGLKHSAQQRTVRIAAARAAYLSAFWRGVAAGEKYDLLMVADLDGLNANLVSDPDFTKAINSAPDGWGAVFANQRGTYYDIWALRHPTWCPGDCWEPVRDAKRRWFGGKAAAAKAKQINITARQIHIDPGELPIEVQSAFGGFGIYRTEFLTGAQYLGLSPQGGLVCEHVSFNEAVRQNGGALYILPALLNDTHP